MSFNDHYNDTDEKRQPLLVRIRREVHDWDSRLIEKVTAGQRIAYSKPGRSVFLAASHEWHQLARRVKLQTSDELERVLPLIRTAWQRG